MAEAIEPDNSLNLTDVLEGTEEQLGHKDGIEATTSKKVKFTDHRLPLARVKNIMKLDPNCNILSQDAVFLTTKATELFIEMMGLATYEFTIKSKKKTLLMPDFDKVLKSEPRLCFLDGMLES